VFFYFFLPEMKGRTLEELDELFQNRISVRDFAQYECLSSEMAKEMAARLHDPREEKISNSVDKTS